MNLILSLHAHLAHGFNPLPDAEIADDPDKQETESQVTVNRT